MAAERQQACDSKMAAERQQAYYSKGVTVARSGRGDNACCRTLAVETSSGTSADFSPTQMTHKGLVGWRYDARSNYMITLVTEPRSDLFGTLREWGVERSVAGKAVYDGWQMIERRFPTVRATYNMIMPDHFHGIVYVTVEGSVDLNEVVQFFAETVERSLGRKVWAALYRDSICLAKGQLHRQINYVLSNARRRWVKKNNPDLFRKVLGFRHWRLRRASAACGAVGAADDWGFWSFVRDPGAECWSLEGGEEIAKPRKANQVVSPFGEGERQQVYDSKVGERQQAHDSKVGERQQAYDNKVGERQQAYGSKVAADSCCRTLAVDWVALGNPFLLEAPLLISTRISTTIPSADLDALVDKAVSKASRGAVIVSPFISPGEKAVKEAVLEAGGSVVQLLAEGMGRYYKPAGREFDCCAEGRLLQLSPFQPQAPGKNVRDHYGKPRFEWLNLAARNIADLALDWARPNLTRKGKS